MDTDCYVKAMRLFKDAPKWEALTNVDQPERDKLATAGGEEKKS